MLFFEVDVKLYVLSILTKLLENIGPLTERVMKCDSKTPKDLKKYYLNRIMLKST